MEIIGIANIFQHWTKPVVISFFTRTCFIMVTVYYKIAQRGWVRGWVMLVRIHEDTVSPVGICTIKGWFPGGMEIQIWTASSRLLRLWRKKMVSYQSTSLNSLVLVDIRRSLRVNIGPVGQISPAAPDQWTTQHGSLVSTDFIWNSKRGEPWFRRNIHEVSQYNWNEWQVASYTKYLKHIWTTKQQVGNQ